MNRLDFINLGFSVFSKVIGFASSTIFAHVLGVDQLGQYYLALLYLSYVPFSLIGIVQGYNQTFYEFSDSERDLIFSKFNNTTMVLSFFASVLILPMSVGFSWIGGIALIAVSVSGRFFENATNYLLGRFQFKRNLVLRFVVDSAAPFLIVTGAYYLGMSRAEDIFIGLSIFLAICIAIMARTLPIGSVFLSWTQVKRFWRIGGPVYLVGLLDFGFRNLDKIFLSKFFPIEDFAGYAFLQNLTLMIWTVCLQILSPYAQRFLEAINQENYLRQREILARTFVLMLSFGSLGAVAVVIGYPLLDHFLFKGKFGASENLLGPLILNAVLLALNNMNIYYVTYKRRYGVMLWGQAILTIFNLVCNAAIIMLKMPLIYMVVSSAVIMLGYFLFLSGIVYKDVKKYRHV